jgi:hypothetical protein
MVVIAALAALGAAPALPEVTEAEQAQLEKGKLVVRSGIDDVAFKVMGIIEIDSTADKVWTEILDFDARLAENAPAKAFDMYLDETTDGTRNMAARWDLKVLGQDITYYDTYQYNAAEQLLTFSLDEEQESDLERIEGYYQTVPSPILENGTRLVYVVDMDTGRKLPESFQKFLANHSLKETLRALKRRAEL